VDSQQTEVLSDSRQTEILKDQPETEILSDPSGGIDWKRSDIYSLGATVYHLLSGVRPNERAGEVQEISQLGPFSEGIVYVVEKSMRADPAGRFADAAVLGQAVRNIRMHDARWRASRAKKIAASVILPVAFIACLLVALYGRAVMGQEKEERYYDAVYAIGNSTDPQAAYEAALSEYPNRIDPYLAMAQRLFADGDLDGCKDYIESSLGSIAQFQAAPEASRSFGDIYYILGNCYYYESDFENARDNFGIALQYVTDNPYYYRDYAVSLARTMYVDAAGQALAKAVELNLEQDSVSLLEGEIAYAKGEYDAALDSFFKVIEQTGDDYLRYRAYHSADEIYKMRGQYQRSVDLLSESLNRIPLNRVPEMTERLADSCTKTGDYRRAIELFEQLSESGPPQFHIRMNLAILYEYVGDFGKASETLEQMAVDYPEDYRVPMQQAFLEADRQSKIANESRDYSLCKQYYDRAAALYNKNVKPGESDPDMQRLESLMQQLRDNNWI